MHGTASRRQRFLLYGVIIACGAILIGIALLTWRSSASDKQATQKANELIAALDAAGARTPTVEQVTRTLGHDGGAVCATPDQALTKAALLAELSNGAGGPGTRPVIADSRLVHGELLVISIYCPDKLPQFQQFVDQLSTSPVAGG